MENLLFTFLKIFNAKPKGLKQNNGIVTGAIVWLDDDDEEELIECDFHFTKEESRSIELILKELLDMELIKGDRILKKKGELLTILSTMIRNENIAEYLEKLENFKVFFIEDDKRTDSLFLHY